MTNFTNTDDIIDSRDIIERIEELETEIEDIEEMQDDDYEYDDLKEELETLQGVIDDIGDEAPHGVTLINESYFEEYAENLASDIGAIDSVSWPLNHINWEAAADELKMDYTEVVYDERSYYYR